MKRRTLLSGTAAAGIVGLSGCLSSVLGSITSLESTPAAVSQSALDETDYQQVDITEIINEEDVDAAGFSDTIVVTSHTTEYEKAIGIQGVAQQATALFSILSTPKIEVAGRTFNPVAEMSSQQLVDMVADNYDEINNIEQETDGTVTILGQSVTKTQFLAEASLDGITIDLRIHVSEAVERGDDLLVMIGVHPERLESEQENIRLLIEEVTEDTASAEDSEELAVEIGSESTEIELDREELDEEDFDEEDFDEEDFDEEDFDEEDFDEEDFDQEDFDGLLGSVSL